MANSDSSKLARLKEYLSEHKCSFVSDVRTSHSANFDFALFVPGEKLAGRSDKNHTSWRQMRQLQNTILKNLNISIEWIVTPGAEVGALEAALYEILQTRFPGAFTGVFVSSPKLSPV